MGRVMARDPQTVNSPHPGLIQVVSRLAPPALGRLIPLSSPGRNKSVLINFVKRVRSGRSERVPVPRRLRWTLWVWILIELGWAIWLVASLSGPTACHGRLCTIATLRHHEAALLACTALCIIGLTALAFPTRALSQCDGKEVIGLAIASAAGGAALLGIAALLIVGVIAVMLIAIFFLAFTATS
jgi:hypothetical protein